MRATVLLFAVLAGCSSASDSGSAGAPSHGQSPAPPPITGGLSEKEFADLHKLSPDRGPPVRGEEIQLPGVNAHAYLTLAPMRPAPMPAVLVIHEWWGLNAHIRRYADRIADEGYAALAVDLYDGKAADTPEKAMELMKSVDGARAAKILAAAQEFLREDPRVRAPRVGVIGWCFGGAWSLRTALAKPSPTAAVVYYGQPILEREQLARLQCPLLLVYGTRDKSIPEEKVRQMDALLGELGKDRRLLLFDAEHAFANPSGPNYASGPAEQAWDETRAFLAQHLR